jgi:hypothetical protein
VPVVPFRLDGLRHLRKRLRRVRHLGPLAAVLAVVIAGILLQRPITTHLKTMLILSNEFPQVPVKPLRWISAPPIHEKLELESNGGRIVADLFLPGATLGTIRERSRPALILAMGIKTKEEDKPVLLRFAETMSRLGFAVLWPRREELERGVSLPEAPDTFVAGFRHLEGVDIIDRDRISMIGFSVGASIALVAAQDPAIADKLHALVFFGGYYDLADYFVSLATRTAALDGEVMPWDASDAAINHTIEILQEKDADTLLTVFNAPTREEAERRLRSVPIEERHGLSGMDPSGNMPRFQARIFILHDKADRYVPYVQSIKLRDAVPPDVEAAFLLIELFEHVQPGGGMSWETARNAAMLYGFVVEAIGYL